MASTQVNMLRAGPRHGVDTRTQAKVDLFHLGEVSFQDGSVKTKQDVGHEHMLVQLCGQAAGFFRKGRSSSHQCIVNAMDMGIGNRHPRLNKRFPLFSDAALGIEAHQGNFDDPTATPIAGSFQIQHGKPSRAIGQ